MRLYGEYALILIYDFHPHGHCPGWLGLTALAFVDAGCEIVVACCADCDPMVPVAEMICKAGGRVIVIPNNVRIHAEHAVQLASALGIRHVFFPNFDTVVYEMGKKSGRVNFGGLSIGGIWLRPTLEGDCLVGFRKIINKLSWTQQSKVFRKKARTIANNRNGISMLTEGSGMANDLFLFLLNGEQAEGLQKHLPNHKQSYICDPWVEKSETNRFEARKRLGLDQERKYFLHAGTSNPGKGLADACLAFSRLPTLIKKSVCLLRAGAVGRGDAAVLNALERDDLAFVMDRYLRDEELLLCFSACDGVLMPYRDQKESSGILIHAAVHERPVIASDYGVIGEWTKKYNLGLTFCHKDIDALSRSIEELCLLDGWCSDGMLEFSRINSPKVFKETIVNALVDRRLFR